MKATQISKSIFTATTVLLCTAVISSCGASKESKRSEQKQQTTTNQPPIDGAPTTASTPVPQQPQAPGGAPVGRQVGETQTTEGNDTTVTTPKADAAPVGRVNTEDKKNEDTKKPGTNSVPDFKEDSAIKTGGQTGELNFTSASDDGIMELFRSKATTVSKEQQEMNSNLAKAINGARLKKSGSDYNLDLAITGIEKAELYKLKATADGNKMKLSLVSTTGDLEFQDGFVKCLDESCDTSYAKIKMSGAYVRVIFRTMNMNNHFMIQKDVQDDGLNLWKSYIQNTIEGSASSAQIEMVKASSYEILNGKSAMGIQLTTKDNQAVVLNTLLVAPEKGTDLKQKITKVTDLSMNYNLASTAGKANLLSSKVTETSLVKNNGKGQMSVKLAFSSGAIWMVLSPVKSKSMTADEVSKFESTLAAF